MTRDAKATLKRPSLWRRSIDVLTSQILYGVLVKTIRGSLLLMGGLMIVSGTSAWKFAESSFSAHDFVRSAHWMGNRTTDVVTIGIDDTAYKEYFGGNSPLDRGKLLSLLQAIQNAAPGAKKIVIDLDLSPVLSDPQDHLFSLFAARKDLWVLAEPIRGPSDETEATKSWRQRLCTAGMLVGLPYLPTEFGYLNDRQQFADSLADVAVRPRTDSCRVINKNIEAAKAEDRAPAMAKLSFPMSPSYARDGMVVPFHGDLQELASALKTISPKYLVVGGFWGTGDILTTPFGDRYGAQLHAAAIDGALKDLRALPYVLNFLVMWCSLALLTIVLSVLQKGLHSWQQHVPAGMPGHQFLGDRLWPIFVILLIFGWILGLSELLAMQFAWSGVQISTAVSAAAVIVYLMFSWNFGLKQIHHELNFRATLSKTLLGPIRKDWNSVAGVAHRWMGHRGPDKAPDPKFAILASGPAALEFSLALTSLLLQSLIPMVILYFSILKSF
jgi:hypothetical protein